jgi:tight adherence protein C
MTFLLLLLGLLCLGVFIVAAVRLATYRRLRTAERLANIQDYGFAADRVAPATLPIQASSSRVTRFVNRLGDLFSQIFGSIREANIRAELMAAGMYTMSPRTLVGYRVIAAVTLPILMLLLVGLNPVGVLLAAILAVIGWMLPLVLVRRQARLRLAEIDRRLPDLIDLLVVTIEAGLGFAGALRVASDYLQGPLSDELRLTLQEQTMGLAVDDALSNLLARSDTPGMRTFVRAMTQGDRLGVSVGQIMRNLAVDMRKRRRQAAEEKAQRAPVKMLFPLVFLIFPAVYIVLLLPALLSLSKTLG